MPRARTIPDATVFACLRAQLAAGGERSVTFARMAECTGLAGATLVQRFGNREAMIDAALADGWKRLEALTDEAEARAALNPRGAAAMLKQIARDGGDDIRLLLCERRSAVLRQRAEAWRHRVEGALALRLTGGGARNRRDAAILFAAWQGRLIWVAPGAHAFRLRDLIRGTG